MGTGGNGNNVGDTVGSHDGGYNGGASRHHNIGENLSALTDHYEYEDGYFGEMGSSADKRRIASDDPLSTAEDFYEKAAKGGVEKPIIDKKTRKKKGVMSDMKDGTTISMRPVSSSPDESPAIDIVIKRSSDSAGVKGQKIHFVKDEEV